MSQQSDTQSGIHGNKQYSDSHVTSGCTQWNANQKTQGMELEGGSEIMKGTLIRSVLISMLIVLPITGLSMSIHRDRPSVRLDGRLNCPYVGNNGGRIFLQLSVVASEYSLPDRPRLNLAVVLDHSGSMAAEGKIQNAKAALRALIDQLDCDDIVSLVIYDDVVDVLRPAGRVGNKEALRRLVDEVTPRGWTNLGGGMMEGFEQVERYATRGYVNRVVLLSDGLANQGITDPRELNRIVREHLRRSISLTTMGVGLEYNENLMVGLSENGGGNYYFIESARNLASVLRNEFQRMSCVLAQNARIELTLGRGVRVLDVVGCERRDDGSRYVISVGDLYAGERREFTVELEIPEGTGTMTVANGTLYYETEIARLGHPSFSSSVRYTHDVAEIDKHRDMETQAKGDIAFSTRAVQKAMQALDEGRQEEAKAVIATAQEALAASPAASSGAGSNLQLQSAKLQSYSSMITDGSADSKKVKKSIQYDNYRTQKQR
jgi:Ca-activated chloride channel family protein